MTTRTLRAADLTADTYVYGLVPPGSRPPDGVTGVAGRPVEVVALEGFGVLVSRDVDDDEFGVADDLLAHGRVLDDAAREGTVLPLAFGTFGPGPGAGEDWHRSLGNAYRHSVQRVDGTVQYSLRVRYLEDVALAELLHENPRIAQLSQRTRGTRDEEERAAKLELGRLVVEGVEEKARSDADRIVRVLEPFVHEVSVRDRRQPDDLADLAVLVDRDGTERFESEAERVAGEFAERARFRLIGPQAPYDFVSGAGGWA